MVEMKLIILVRKIKFSINLIAFSTPFMKILLTSGQILLKDTSQLCGSLFRYLHNYKDVTHSYTTCAVSDYTSIFILFYTVHNVREKL